MAPTTITTTEGNGRPRGGRTLALALLTLALLLSSAATAVAAPRGGGTGLTTAPTTATSYRCDVEEKAFLTLINNYRATRSLKALRLTKTLGAAADHHSADMATKNYFSHTLAGGIGWSQNIKNHGYTFNTYRGENIAAGNSAALATFNQWKNSPGHNANMLSKNFNAIGIGRAYGASSTYKTYWTTTFGGYQDAAAAC